MDVTKSRILYLFAVVAILAGCTTDPMTGEDKTTNTAEKGFFGAVLGGIAGGLAAKASGKDARTGAIVGAAGGAALGALYGAKLDEQEEALRAELESTGVSVTRRDKNIVLNMNKALVFQSGSAEIDAQGMRVLSSLSKVLNRFDESRADVFGYSDSQGPAEANREISERRAGSVVRTLQDMGISPERLSYTGMGEADPIAPNDTPEGRALNRRVEIHIAPLT